MLGFIVYFTTLSGHSFGKYYYLIILISLMAVFLLVLVLSMKFLFFLHLIGPLSITVIIVCCGIYKLENKENKPLMSMINTIFFYLYLLIVLFFNTKWIF